MAKVLKGGSVNLSDTTPSHKGHDAREGEKQGIFIKMFGVLIFLCLLYVPIIHSLGHGILQYPGYLQ
ncbi:MAG: hypothetical protein LCH26_01430 [Proteobacteria bacterium]|nr:hypothetical protein [Pseudomonadota bacterium]